MKNKKHRHILFILFLVALGTFFIYKEFSKKDFIPLSPLKQIKPEDKKKPLPKIALVLDDLGQSKKAAEKVFDINASFTLSILPQETHTSWIADEAQRLGYDVIGHIPMEAKIPHKLGKGGLYTWMTENEIRDVLERDINSIPHITGVSNHMGSAFTEDERAMSIVMSVLKDHELFFLDSLTNPRSLGSALATEHNIRILKRDIFLDNKDNPDYIREQWQKAVRIAQKRGYAIVLAHPKKSTTEFLEQAFAGDKDEVEIVPLSALPVTQ
ncbi:MAG: divergent polysaccharide deacetylase family protein [Thermodesulfovibrionia bacterium]|nr:divergent polysaccharide deacetylase family protein [Thermodesulfovibrionia bacterium]